jgi:Uma2 family endonuclease
MNAIPSQFAPDRMDQRVTLHGISWADYEAVLAMRGDDGGVRLTYLKGELELMTPSMDHEEYKKRLARLLEAYAEERGIDLEGYGSWTVRQAKRERGVEPDECYVVGVRERSALQAPDIAIEVIWTSGGIDKLEVYRGLGVREVWFWQEGKLQFYLREGGAYRQAPRSRLLPGFDPDLIATFMSGSSQTQAVRAFRSALHEHGKQV